MRYDKTAVLAAFRPLIGFKSNEKYPLTEDLTTSESGLYFNSVHAILKNLKTVSDCAPDANSSDGETVDDRRELWLSELRDDAILKAIDTVLNEKIVRGQSSDLFTKRTIFANGNINNILNPSGRFVGFKILPVNDNYTRFRIRRIGFQGTEAGTIPILLINSNKNDGFVDHLDIVYTTPNSVQTFDCDFEINQYDYAGGEWFLCYDQSQYSGKAIFNKLNFNPAVHCSSCGHTTFDLTKIILNKFMQIYPASIKADLVYLDNESYTQEWDNNFGLNFEIEGTCDYTKILVDNKDLFTNYIHYLGGISLVREIITNANVVLSRNQSNADSKSSELRYDIEGDPKNPTGSLNWNMQKAFEAIQMDLNGKSIFCFTNDNRGKFIHSVR